MPVVINDFEVTVEPPRQGGGGAQAGSSSAQTTASAAAPGLRPADIDQIVKHFYERRRRVVAD